MIPVSGPFSLLLPFSIDNLTLYGVPGFKSTISVDCKDISLLDDDGTLISTASFHDKCASLYCKYKDLPFISIGDHFSIKDVSLQSLNSGFGNGIFYINLFIIINKKLYPLYHN